MVYLDQAATSFPKLDVVKQAVMDALGVAGNANRSSNMDFFTFDFCGKKKYCTVFLDSLIFTVLF